ncbi:MAG: hypothetical protein LBR09_01815 [Endomicrobium sp.]|nr:hypothetical protein [Endomicrobium sp.]
MKKISGVGLCIAMLGGCSQTPTTDLNGLSYKDLKAEYLRRKMKRKEIQQYEGKGSFFSFGTFLF